MDLKGNDSGTLPLNRIRVPEETKYKVCEPKPFSTEQVADVKGYIRFILKLLQDYGTSIADDVFILMGFGGFTFQSSVIREEGKSPKTEISIWYHPQRKEPMPGYQSVSVADISFNGEMYSGQDWARGKEFQVHEGWQKELKNLIANQRSAVKDYENGGHIPSAPIQMARNSEAEEAERVQRGKEFRSRITSPLTLLTSRDEKSA